MTPRGSTPLVLLDTSFSHIATVVLHGACAAPPSISFSDVAGSHRQQCAPTAPLARSGLASSPDVTVDARIACAAPVAVLVPPAASAGYCIHWTQARRGQQTHQDGPAGPLLQVVVAGAHVAAAPPELTYWQAAPSCFGALQQQPRTPQRGRTAAAVPLKDRGRLQRPGDRTSAR
jgi:hypothetical protein